MLTLWGLFLPLAHTPLVQAQTPAAQNLPPAFATALERIGIPTGAVSVFISAAHPGSAPLVAYRENASMNPASVMKLVTSYAALDLLGPDYTWKTTVAHDGRIANGVLQGNLIIKGMGDPQIVAETLWLITRRIAAQGIRDITGNVLIDNTAFEASAQSPNDFDGNGLRSYNSLPSALLLNYSSVLFEFNPLEGQNIATVLMTPSLHGLNVTESIPLSDAPCADWKTSLNMDFNPALGIRFRGSYPKNCGRQYWPIAYPSAEDFNARLLRASLEAVGIKLRGEVVSHKPSTAQQAPNVLFTHVSPPLSQTLRDINKFSNNVMTRNLFLTLSLEKNGYGSLTSSRQLVQEWWRRHWPQIPAPLTDNGAGLSLDARISTSALGYMLAHAYQSPLMPELLSSMPIAGIDGTLRRSNLKHKGRAHLKTGTMPQSGVSAIAGYVHTLSGERLVLVAIINHARAAQARPAFDALIDEAIEMKKPKP